jgi:hypothetical protein
LFFGPPPPPPVGGGGGGDKGVSLTPLKNLISDTEGWLTGKRVSENGSDVSEGEEYIKNEQKTSFQAAIAAAKAIKDNPSSTQSEIDTAYRNLNDAWTAIKATCAAQTGSGTSETLKTALETLIDTAEGKLDDEDLNVAENGNALSVDQHYIKKAQKEALQAAITEAQSVLDNSGATDGELSAAIGALQAAISAFDTAFNSQTGIIVDSDKDALIAAITAAQAAISDVMINENAGDVPRDIPYVTQAEFNAYSAAIEAAVTVKDNVSATQAQVDAAVTALTEATAAFETALQKVGTKNEWHYRVSYDLW